MGGEPRRQPRQASELQPAEMSLHTCACETTSHAGAGRGERGGAASGERRSPKRPGMPLPGTGPGNTEIGTHPDTGGRLS